MAAPPTQNLEYALLAVDVAADKQASDILMLDISAVSDFADYFVISTVESQRQMSALREDLEKALEDRGAILHHREGTDGGGWTLLDFGDLVVHLFGPEERTFYEIEAVWGKGVETRFQ